MALDVAQALGRTILLLGIVLVALGLVLLLGVRLPRLIGRLPGDISWSRGGVHIFFPLGTCILLSLVLTIILSFISWLRR
jgi:hypothetical protein